MFEFCLRKHNISSVGLSTGEEEPIRLSNGEDPRRVVTI